MTSQRDLISIITVCKGETNARLAATLKSVTSQDYSHIEIVIVDGGTDDTVESVLGEISQVTVVICRGPDTGIYDAMNRGIAACHGQWLLFLNVGDMLASRQVLTRLLEASRNDRQPVLVYGDAALGKSGQQAWVARTPRRVERWFLYGSTICHQAMLAQRNTLVDAGGFDLSYCLLADRNWLLGLVDAQMPMQHCGFVVCTWEAGGRSSQLAAFKREERRFRRDNFSLRERVAYGTLWVVLRAIRRLRMQLEGIRGSTSLQE